MRDGTNEVLHRVSDFGRGDCNSENRTFRLELQKVADPNDRNVYFDPAYERVREELKVQMWREQERLGDAPHASQPRPQLLEELAGGPGR